MHCEDIEAFMYQGGGNVILGRKRIASGYVHLRTAFCEDFAKVGCLGFKMDRQGDPESAERFRPLEIPFKPLQQRHVMPYPVDLKFSALPESFVTYFAHFGIFTV